MPIETIPGSVIPYFLIDFDRTGRERDDPQATSGKLSDSVAATLTDSPTGPVTDVFFMSHGWQGDVPAAKRQFSAWSSAMLACTADLQRARDERPGFSPLIVGLHWPSLPWGDEDPTARPVAFGVIPSDPIDALVDDAAEKLVDTTRARAALRTIFSTAFEDLTPSRLPERVVDAYQVLEEETGLAAEGPGGAPGEDRDGFDSEALYEFALETDDAFGDVRAAGGLLAPLRQLSFWQMKARARCFGQSGAADLLRRLQRLTAGRDVRFHLMGHSFGCIVASAAIKGAADGEPLERPVHSLFLAQGALSLWAYCSDIPMVAGARGYFHPLIAEGKVAGPIVTTQSLHDTAVRRLYPLATGVAGQVDFGPGSLPKYGGVGVFGIQGPGIDLEDRQMLPPERDYGLSGGHVYNLESSDFINQGGGLAGAHNDIAKPAVGHACWQAITTCVA